MVSVVRNWPFNLISAVVAADRGLINACQRDADVADASMIFRQCHGCRRECIVTGPARDFLESPT